MEEEDAPLVSVRFKPQEEEPRAAPEKPQQRQLCWADDEPSEDDEQEEPQQQEEEASSIASSNAGISGGPSTPSAVARSSGGAQAASPGTRGTGVLVASCSDIKVLSVDQRSAHLAWALAYVQPDAGAAELPPLVASRFQVDWVSGGPLARVAQHAQAQQHLAVAEIARRVGFRHSAPDGRLPSRRRVTRRCSDKCGSPLAAPQADVPQRGAPSAAAWQPEDLLWQPLPSGEVEEPEVQVRNPCPARSSAPATRRPPRHTFSPGPTLAPGSRLTPPRRCLSWPAT